MTSKGLSQNVHYYDFSTQQWLTEDWESGFLWDELTLGGMVICCVLKTLQKPVTVGWPIDVVVETLTDIRVNTCAKFIYVSLEANSKDSMNKRLH